MQNRTSLRQQLEAFNNGQIMDSSGDIDTECYNFYDWFCKDSSLEAKAKRLFSNVKTFVKNTPSLDTDKVYVFFKNNCPMVGGLYDSFSICDRESGNVIFWVAPNRRGKAELYFEVHGFETPTKQANSFRGLFMTE